ncbi:putative argininosuccinate synthase protein [Eutypa lata UCREL1]|uniref:Argininosuccinate synthase n=1 Tax=Eutypa lata (strain UCR-EL1) TaxID=1287681 RepID=M7SS27_EUTLA|nr:putative argininosuccinate synthase protein [Eutypa lata UCREL1]
MSKGRVCLVSLQWRQVFIPPLNPNERAYRHYHARVQLSTRDVLKYPEILAHTFHPLYRKANISNVGLDTSTILKYLVLEGYTVVAYLANVGQEEDWAEVEKKALYLGAEKMVIRDLQKEFVEEIVHRAIQCNAIYEDRYLLGTSLARPIIAREQVRVAKEENCTILSHGCTGKGNDQVRFELAFYALLPTCEILAPWRMPEFIEKFKGRNDLLDFAKLHNIAVSSTPKAPWSMDSNLVHCSYEAGALENVDYTPPKELWTQTIDPEDAPDKPYHFTLFFEKGVPVKIITEDKKEVTDSLELFKLLNKIGHDHGVGRIDIVENRFIGLKSRGCYDTPGLTIARLAHIDLVLDSRVRELRDQFCTLSWSRQLYNGMYFSPEREFIENSIVFSQESVNGKVRMMAYKGQTYVLGRSSESSNLYSEEDASMDSLDTFSPMDTTGFIAINAIRLKKYGLQKEKDGKPLTEV